MAQKCGSVGCSCAMRDCVLVHRRVVKRLIDGPVVAIAVVTYLEH
jgi:hypothetical protein